MKEFHFSKIYFNKLRLDDEKSKIRIEIKERPSLDIEEEDYSLRVDTWHEDNNQFIRRKCAIEHHREQAKHSYPHVQFKFHTEEIGEFWIKLNFRDSEEYKKGILGFVYKTKEVLENLEKYKQGITREILILEMVNKLRNEGDFLFEKISESIDRREIEFQDENKLNNLGKNPLLIKFLGISNIKKIIKTYKD